MGAAPDETIRAVIARMEAHEPTVARDARRFFHATYLRTTRAIAAAAEAGHFTDRDWVERWDARFASLYLDALEAAEAGGAPGGPAAIVPPADGSTARARVPTPWQVAFAAAGEDDLEPLRHVLLGMNAHINFDLPQALLAVVDTDDFADPDVLARRERDHRRVDDVLADRVAAEDRELQAVETAGTRTLLDHVLGPLHRSASRRFIAEAREKVWHNATRLDAARRAGPAAYAEGLARLEALSAQRVTDLRRPGRVVLRLARDGFGVRLDDVPAARATPAP